MSDCPGRNTLELVLAAPRAGFGGVELYPSFAAKTGVLVYGLSKSQACPDGNKRVALIVLRAFLHINGRRLEAGDEEIVEAILRAATSPSSSRGQVIIDLTGWLERVIQPYAKEKP